MRHIIIVLVVIIVIFIIEYFIHKKNLSHYVNYLKYTKLNNDISLEDSNIYIDRNPGSPSPSGNQREDLSGIALRLVLIDT